MWIQFLVCSPAILFLHLCLISLSLSLSPSPSLALSIYLSPSLYLSLISSLPYSLSSPSRTPPFTPFLPARFLRLPSSRIFNSFNRFAKRCLFEQFSSNMYFFIPNLSIATNRSSKLQARKKCRNVRWYSNHNKTTWKMRICVIFWMRDNIVYVAYNV